MHACSLYIHVYNYDVMLTSLGTYTCIHVYNVQCNNDIIESLDVMMTSSSPGDFRSLPQMKLNLDMAAQHHRTVIGAGGGNIHKIMEDTGST